MIDWLRRKEHCQGQRQQQRRKKHCQEQRQQKRKREWECVVGVGADVAMVVVVAVAVEQVEREIQGNPCLRKLTCEIWRRCEGGPGWLSFEPNLRGEAKAAPGWGPKALMMR